MLSLLVCLLAELQCVGGWRGNTMLLLALVGGLQDLIIKLLGSLLVHGPLGTRPSSHCCYAVLSCLVLGF